MHNIVPFKKTNITKNNKNKPVQETGSSNESSIEENSDELSSKRQNIYINRKRKCMHEANFNGLPNKKRKVNDKISKEKLHSEWDRNDEQILVHMIKKHINKISTLQDSANIDNLDWDSIKFQDYSARDCKKKCYQLIKGFRKIQSLPELLKEVTEKLENEKESDTDSEEEEEKNKKSKLRKKDLPERPSSAFKLYFKQMKNEVEYKNMTENELKAKWTKLDETDRMKYIKLAYDNQEAYFQKLDKLLEKHGELPMYDPYKRLLSRPEYGLLEKHNVIRLKNTCLSGYHLFTQEMIKSKKGRGDMKEIGRKWKTFSREEQDEYNNKAKQKSKEYQNSLTKAEKLQIENYSKLIQKRKKLLQNCDGYKPKTKKIKRHFDGEPEKPMPNGYCYFCKEHEATFKQKDGMKKVAALWKNMSNEQKKEFNDKAKTAMEKYKEQEAEFIKTLNSEDRDLFIKEKRLIMNTRSKIPTPVKNNTSINSSKTTDSEDSSDSDSSGISVSSKEMNPNLESIDSSSEESSNEEDDDL